MYCSYDSLNPAINKETGKEEHCCGNFDSLWCIKCPYRYDGDRIKEYIATHERIEY